MPSIFWAQKGDTRAMVEVYKKLREVGGDWWELEG
jgi:hypothetical protein